MTVSEAFSCVWQAIQCVASSPVALRTKDFGAETGPGTAQMSCVVQKSYGSYNEDGRASTVGFPDLPAH